MKHQSFVAQIKTNPVMHGLLLGLAILTGYFGLWNAYFTTDDFWMLGWVRHKPAFAEAVWAQFGYSLRILLDVVLWLRVRVFDLNPVPYYWISLAQHVVVTLIVYRLIDFLSRSRQVAFLAALLYGTTFSYFEVVTWITGSNYSLAAIPYLGALGLFGLALARQSRAAYWASVGLFVCALLLTELSLTLPLMLIAYHTIYARGDQPLRSLVNRRAIGSHLPYWGLLAVYVLVQLEFVRSGSSEAMVAAAVYRPGWHMPGNLFYLVYLLVPPYGPGAVIDVLGVSGALVQAGLVGLALAGHALAALAFWKGSNLVRFSLAFVYVPFLPYTLWDGGFAGAIRYRYLPAIGLSLLLAMLLVHIHRLVSARKAAAAHFVIPLVSAALVASNVVLVQVWVRRHLEASEVRRAVVTGLAGRPDQFRPDTHIYLEVPAEKYEDLGYACDLLFSQPLECEAFVAGERQLEDLVKEAGASPLYVFRATREGLSQVYPISPSSQ